MPLVAGSTSSTLLISSVSKQGCANACVSAFRWRWISPRLRNRSDLVEPISTHTRWQARTRTSQRRSSLESPAEAPSRSESWLAPTPNTPSSPFRAVHRHSVSENVANTTFRKCWPAIPSAHLSRPYLEISQCRHPKYRLLSASATSKPILSGAFNSPSRSLPARFRGSFRLRGRLRLCLLDLPKEPIS